MFRKLALGLVLLMACSEGEAGSDPAADAVPPPAADTSEAGPDLAESGGGTTTASGLTIHHTTVGLGESPSRTNVVLVHYHGTFPEGRVFDSSIQRGEPARFPLNRVIPCWTEGLQLMKVGGKATLVCPPEIAYGRRGSPPRIPPNATLHFDVQLLAIE